MLLDGEGRARLADAGLARDVDAGMTMTRGFAVGTPGYLDPEYSTTYTVTVASDVFSLGVVLLELLTGAPAFDGAERPPPLFARLGPRLPDGAVDLAAAAFRGSDDLARWLGGLAKRGVPLGKRWDPVALGAQRRDARADTSGDRCPCREPQSRGGRGGRPRDGQGAPRLRRRTLLDGPARAPHREP